MRACGECCRMAEFAENCGTHVTSYTPRSLLPMSACNVKLTALRNIVGVELTTGWHRIEQRRVDQFAAVTADAQWIHVDSVRAAEHSQYRCTVAHGFLVLAVAHALLIDTVHQMICAYDLGLLEIDSVRFPAPLPAGTCVRASCRLTGIEERAGVSFALWSQRMEREDSLTCCAVRWTLRLND